MNKIKWYFKNIILFSGFLWTYRPVDHWWIFDINERIIRNNARYLDNTFKGSKAVAKKMIKVADTLNFINNKCSWEIKENVVEKVFGVIGRNILGWWY